jgi:folate-binding protein YgfZ
LAKALDAGSVPEQPLACAVGRLLGQDLILWRDDPCGVPGYNLLLPTDQAAAIWQHLLTTFGTPGVSGAAVDVGRRKLRPVGWAAFNATRIEGGRPLFGIDFDNTLLPAETGQIARAVSFTKGCYPGQEIVARMHARQQVAKQIVGIRMEGDALPLSGTHIFDDASNQVGGITSSTMSPILSNAAVCLALVKRPFFGVGTVLTIPAEGAMRKGTVVELPFVRE